MMNNRSPRNYSGLFSLFAYDKPDKTGRILQKIGVFGFTTSFALSFCRLFFGAELDLSKSILAKLINILWMGGWVVGIFMFIATGIHYSGREKGKTSFLASTVHMLRNTFLYLFLPVLIITALIMLWAALTRQPAFQ